MESKISHRSGILPILINFDHAVSFRLHSMSRSIPLFLLLFLEISGDGRFFFPVLISALLLPISSPPAFSALLAGGLLDLLLVGLIKYLVRRSRPLYNKGMHLTFTVDHWSFPSGHSSRVFFIASYLYLSSLIPGYGRNHVVAYFFLPIICCWAGITSISRVLLGRHFVLDVVAGACLGVMESLLILYFWRNFTVN